MPPSNLVNGQELTVCAVVWISQQAVGFVSQWDHISCNTPVSLACPTGSSAVARDIVRYALRVWPPKHAPTHTCYYGALWSLYVKACGHNGQPKMGAHWARPWDWDVPAPLQTRPLPTCVITTNLIVVGQAVWTSTYEDPPAKKLGLSRTAFQGHSRSSELTRIDLMSMTSC